MAWWWPFQRKNETLNLFREVFGSRETRAGVTVNWQTAIEVSAVLACVRVIANGVSQVPWRVYQDKGQGKAVALDHPLHPLIYRAPNAWQTSFGFRETVATHAILTGNAFVWKGMVGRERRLTALEPIEPGRVTVKRDRDGELTYSVRADDGATREFTAGEIWHLRGPSWNSWMGMDATKLARDAIGLAIATEQAQADFHKGGARVSGVLSVENEMGKEKFEFLSAWLDRHSGGGDRSGKPIIVDRGGKWTTTQMTGVDAQHLETRRFQVEEICREFGVLPIMVGQSDKAATYASAEQMFLAHVVHTLAPWYERIEQSADVSLLTPEERAKGYYTKFTPNALMRGAAKDRAEYYTAALGSTQQPGWMTRNEVRGLEELDPTEGGDEFPELITNAAPADPAQEDDDGQD